MLFVKKENITPVDADYANKACKISSFWAISNLKNLGVGIVCEFKVVPPQGGRGTFQGKVAGDRFNLKL